MKRLLFAAVIATGLSLTGGGVAVGVTTPAPHAPIVREVQPTWQQAMGGYWACQYKWGPAYQTTNYAGKVYLERTGAWRCWYVG